MFRHALSPERLEMKRLGNRVFESRADVRLEWRITSLSMGLGYHARAGISKPRLETGRAMP
jgi:hypothetical protein